MLILAAWLSHQTRKIVSEMTEWDVKPYYTIPYLSSCCHKSVVVVLHNIQILTECFLQKPLLEICSLGV